MCPEEALADSLPYSLRHHSRQNALEEAVDLVNFLGEIAWKTDSEFIFEGWPGLRHVLDLIHDKIDIGRGAYKFPLSAITDAPVLAERVKDE
jgi:hypothetical protein